MVPPLNNRKNMDAPLNNRKNMDHEHKNALSLKFPTTTRASIYMYVKVITRGEND